MSIILNITLIIITGETSAPLGACLTYWRKARYASGLWSVIVYSYHSRVYYITL